MPMDAAGLSFIPTAKVVGAEEQARAARKRSPHEEASRELAQLLHGHGFSPDTCSRAMRKVVSGKEARDAKEAK